MALPSLARPEGGDGDIGARPPAASTGTSISVPPSATAISRIETSRSVSTGEAGRAGEGRGDAQLAPAGPAIGAAVGGDIDLVRHLRHLAARPAGAEADRGDGHAARFRHLQPVAAEGQRTGEARRGGSSNGGFGAVHRLVPPDRLVARLAAAGDDAPVGPLPHQPGAQPRGHGVGVAVERDDLERRLRPGIHRQVGKQRLHPDQAVGGPHRQGERGAGGAAARLVDGDRHLRGQRLRGVGRPRQRQGQAALPLGVQRLDLEGQQVGGAPSTRPKTKSLCWVKGARWACSANPRCRSARRPARHRGSVP